MLGALVSEVPLKVLKGHDLRLAVSLARVTEEHRVEVGDRALIFTLTETLPDLERMFRGR